jgi:hypothetical protein
MPRKGIVCGTAKSGGNGLAVETTPGRRRPGGPSASGTSALFCYEEAGLTVDDARYAGRALVQGGYIEGHVPLEDDDPKQYVAEHSSH